MIGDLISRRSRRMPSLVTICRRREFVAYKEVIDHILQFFAAQQDEIAPPFLETQGNGSPADPESPRRCILCSKRCWRAAGVEVRDQPGAIEEDAVAEIAGQTGKPAPAEHPAQVAHRILAMNTGPVGERRTATGIGPKTSGRMQAAIIACQPA